MSVSVSITITMITSPTLFTSHHARYVYNKIDSLSIEEIDDLARKPDSLVISVHLNLNMDYMLQKMWE